MADNLSAYQIHQGFWINWSGGWADGCTLTLSVRNGTLLTNSLALFVTLAGSQLWTILRFAIHQIRTSRWRSENTEHQIQQRVILRNATTDFTTMLLMMQIAWKSRRTRPVSFPALIAGFAILHYTLFLIAGAFSGQLIGASSEVLLRDPSCGIWQPDYFRDYQSSLVWNTKSLQTLEVTLAYQRKVYRDIDFSLDYAQDCYRRQTVASSSLCNALPRRSISFNQTLWSQDCPFGELMCHGDADSVIFDTGMINSHHDLGINAPEEDQVEYRRLTTCSVLNDTGRIIDVEKPNNSSVQGAQTITRAFYGNQTNLNIGNLPDLTYAHSELRPYFTNSTGEASVIPYELDVQFATGKSLRSDMQSTFTPIRELEPGSSDLTLFFLSFQGKYLTEINDPWFSAHRVVYKNVEVEWASKKYLRDWNISTVACKEQHQLCTSAQGCSSLLGWNQLLDYVDESMRHKLTPRQNVTFDRLLEALQVGSLVEVAWALLARRAPLLAAERAFISEYALSLDLADNQWQLEVSRWHTVALAELQRRMMQWATGDVVADPKYIIPPETDAEKWFCKNFKVLSTRHLSFNVLAIVFIILAGSFTIVASWHIEDLTGWIQLRYKRGVALRKVWDEDDMLSLRSCANRCSWRPQLPPKEYTSDRIVGFPEKREAVVSIIEVPDKDLEKGGWNNEAALKSPVMARAKRKEDIRPPDRPPEMQQLRAQTFAHSQGPWI